MRTQGRGLRTIGSRTLAIVMAGGCGSRLAPLTRWHAKPALPFGGAYRNIDFSLSNCVNSGIRRIAVATQYKAHSLIQHVAAAWDFLPREMGEFVEIWPAQQRLGLSWYEGTADAIYQNLDLIEHYDPDFVLVLAGDHVYKMDYREMLEAHIARGADATVACILVPIETASSFGILGVDPEGRVIRFDEKPTCPIPAADDSAMALASMGVYVFGRATLRKCLEGDARAADSRRDFGHDVVPALVRSGRVQAFRFNDDPCGRAAYWRDVGTLPSYWQAHMELLAGNPGLDLQDPAWPIFTRPGQSAPARFLGQGEACRSLVASGCCIAGSVRNSVLSTGCRVGEGSIVSASVLLPDARIGAHCRIHGAIVDSGCSIPDGAVVGEPGRPNAHGVSMPEEIVLLTRENLEAHVQPAEKRRVA
jgi:glucose-1-phosphate adenylyltransferase